MMHVLQSVSLDSEVAITADTLAEISRYLESHPITTPVTSFMLKSNGELVRYNGLESQPVADRYIMWGPK